MRSLRLLALLLPLPAAAAAQAAAPIRVPYVLDSLPNGLTWIVHEDHSAPVAAVNVWYHVGSGDEKPGRTGFAHLFEHLMFMGSQHAPYPAFDRLLEGAGANNNGSTSEDRTNYFEVGPPNALPLMLWLEADRMGWMLPTMDSAKVDLQRDVVKNERRQGVENQPYGMVWDHLPGMLYPAGHSYSWPVIGSMADLSAASVGDVKQFFREYYAPNNAVIVVAGDVRADSVSALVRTYFGAIPRGPAPSRPREMPRALARDTALVLEDRVQLARLYYAWPAVKETNPDEAAFAVVGYLLTGAKNGRLTQPLVYERQIASGVQASGDLKRHDGDFYVIATARPGQALPALQQVVDAELARLAAEGPTAREMEQAKNAMEARFLGRLETVAGKADLLNAYYYERGAPDGFQADLDALRAVTAEDVQRVVRNWLLGPRAIVSVVPQGKPELAATGRVTP
ncbi:MAG TPA: pitrilysin family protein [Gemmatimonadales bacterium]|nr:pitrilysin family protein [Gemmatimonadales bacterium]